jgi:peptidoglycan hydrolase-like protein with peptidoglycan-binding domain
MEFALQPRRWVGALVVTAAASLALGVAGTASAQSAAAHAAGHEPVPAAGWHGRPIRHPDVRIPKVARVSERGTSAASVREIQRMLLKVGYTPGPVDGVFGERTRSSVQWFQIKHGFRPTGVADLRTLDYLRSRSSGTAAAAQPKGVHRDVPAPRPARAPAPTPTVVAAAPHDGGMGLLLWLLLAVLAVTALWLVTVAARRYPQLAAPRPNEAPPVAEPVAPSAPAPARVAAPEPVEQPRAEQPRAIGYAMGRDRQELERNAAAIQRACSERGWSLSCLVRDGGTARGRSGLAFALKRMSEESAPRLVVGKLSDLGQSLAEVAAVLAWCARLGVALVALDVGLDTRTEHGRLAARCLLALGSRDRARRAPRRRGNGSQAGSGRRLSARSGHDA